MNAQALPQTENHFHPTSAMHGISCLSKRTITPLCVLIACCWIAICRADAQIPDLTRPEVSRKVDRKNSTYNLGPTGLRGYIHVSRRPGDGPNGTMTGESRQILVTVASAPADKVLQVDDVILGVAWGPGRKAVPAFVSDARKAFGNAITEAEKKQHGGVLRVKRWRAGEVRDVSINLPVMGTYADTAPFTCKKSTIVLENARKHFVGKLLADPGFLTRGHPWSRPVHALALLSAVRPDDPDHPFIQSRIQSYARSISKPEFAHQDGCMWTIGHEGIFLAEYYLATADAEVIPGLEAYIAKLANSMSIYGTCNHRPALPRTDGTGRRSVRGYGAVNNAALPANLAIVMLRKALLAGGGKIDSEVDTSISRGANFYAWFVNKGAIPYGEHHPWISGHSSNGKNACAAVFYSQLEDRHVEAGYYARASIAAFNSREYGHTGQGMSYLWEGMGANVGGAAAVAAYFKPIRWHLDLSRRSDGSFAYDGQEQYGGGSTSDGSYLGKSSYYDLEATAIYLLTHSLPYKRLRITGKEAGAKLELSDKEVANAVFSGNHRMSRTSYTVADLIDHLGEYDPVVRKSAADELATRTLSESDMYVLRGMISSPDPNKRRSACEVLSLLKDPASIGRISGLLDKTVETDPWVRAGAAAALRNYGNLAKQEVSAMLKAFVINAGDPDKIDWAQPTQASNAELSFTLFSPQPGTNHFTFKDAVQLADRDLRVAAVRAAIRHPDSAVRATAAGFVFQSMPAEELVMMPEELMDLALNDTQCDRMWSDPGRQAGVRTLSRHKFIELLPIALKLSVPTQEFWHSGASESAIKEIATYGDAARWALPSLRDSLRHWDEKSAQHRALVQTIEKLESATSAPAIRHLNVQAESGIVATRGSDPVGIILAGNSPRESDIRFEILTPPLHGTLSGNPPNLTYVPLKDFGGLDRVVFRASDTLTSSEPATITIIGGQAGTGLLGQYHSDPDFRNPGLIRLDPRVDFDWTAGGPHDPVESDGFSVKWTGSILVPESGNYMFSVTSGHGVALFIEEMRAIDISTSASNRWIDSRRIELKKGQRLGIRMAYRSVSGPAMAKLKWQGPSFAGMAGEIIPQEFLYQETGSGR